MILSKMDLMMRAVGSLKSPGLYVGTIQHIPQITLLRLFQEALPETDEGDRGLLAESLAKTGSASWTFETLEEATAIAGAIHATQVKHDAFPLYIMVFDAEGTALMENIKDLQGGYPDDE